MRDRGTAEAYRKSHWFKATQGDRHIGACPICNEGTDRFKINWQGKHKDHFFCERCSPPENGRSNQRWWKEVLQKLGVWSNEPPSQREPTVQQLEDRKQRTNRLTKEEEANQRYHQRLAEAEARREQKTNPVGLARAREQEHSPIKHDRANRLPANHQLERNPPIKPSEDGHWRSWGRLYRKTANFKAWLIGKATYPIGAFTEEEQRDFHTQINEAGLTPHEEDQLPDLWIAGTCPVCRKGNLFIGAFTDELRTRNCPLSRPCIQNDWQASIICKGIEEKARTEQQSHIEASKTKTENWQTNPVDTFSSRTPSNTKKGGKSPLRPAGTHQKPPAEREENEE